MDIKPYYQYRLHFSISEGYLVYGSRLYIPQKLRREVLDYLHTGHQGITKCKRRAQQSVWWLGLSQQLLDLVSRCPNCIEERGNPHEPLLKAELPTGLWRKLGIDLFKQKQRFPIATDYYLKFSL